MPSSSSSSKTTFAGRFLLVAAAASFLKIALSEIISITPDTPGGLQGALDQAQPGDTISLGEGDYWESVVSIRDGEADAYITIESADPDKRAVLRGPKDVDNDKKIFELQHSYYRLNQFKIDGMHSSENYVDKCLYVQQNRENEDHASEITFNDYTFRSSINGLVISNMEITNCGGECVRLRYFVTWSQIYNNVISNCGTHDFVMRGGSKNGEGIYVGTSSNQWDDGKNPSNEPDESAFNHIFDNTFNTQGNEGVDIKEGSKYNLIEHNYCTGQKDPESACLDARGDSNVFRYNICKDNVGAGIRIGGHNPDGHQYGQGNEMYKNILENNDYAAIKVTTGPQGAVCENQISGSSEDSKGSKLAEELTPRASCSTSAVDGDLQDDVSRSLDQDCSVCDMVKLLRRKLKKFKKKCKASRAAADMLDSDLDPFLSNDRCRLSDLDDDDDDDDDDEDDEQSGQREAAEGSETPRITEGVQITGHTAATAAGGAEYLPRTAFIPPTI